MVNFNVPKIQKVTRASKTPAPPINVLVKFSSCEGTGVSFSFSGGSVHSPASADQISNPNEVIRIATPNIHSRSARGPNIACPSMASDNDSKLRQGNG